jgi:DNA-binding IclR family transcriptional regulator
MKPIKSQIEDLGSGHRTASVPAVERTVMILDFLAQSRRGVTVSQLTRELRLPKSTTYALLLTLERCGYAQRDPCSGRYRLGLRLSGLANVALAGISLREQSASFLRQLAERTRLTAHMAVLDEGEAVLIEKVTPTSHTVPKIASWAGKRMGLHCTALGKALIAYVGEAEMEEMVRKQGLLRHNENTIASLARLKDQCTRIRRIGYSVDDEEEEIGVRCIGVPVVDGQQRVVAAISVAGTTGQLAEMSGFVNVLKKTALGISGVLGPREPSIPSLTC